MNIRALKLTDDEERRFLPIFIYNTLKKTPHVIISMEREGQEVAYIVMVALNTGKDVAVIWLDSIIEDAFDKIICYEQLIMFGSKLAMENGIRLKSITVLDQGMELMMLDAAIINLGYIPISLHGEYLFFYLESIVREKSFRLLEDYCVKNNISFNALPSNDKSLISFSNELKRRGVYVDFNDYDENLCAFFGNDGIIHGGVVGKKFGEKILYLPAVYTGNGSADSKQISLMLCSIIMKAREFMPPDSELAVRCYDNNVDKGIRAIFGEPSNIMPFHEFVRM